MAIYCSVPNCKNGPGNVTEGIGFYKFPLEDTVRLQQWLKNMDCEKWTPCHQDYICEEHFSASCFIVQWGVRYLCNEAVPTVFHKGQVIIADLQQNVKVLQQREHQQLQTLVVLEKEVICLRQTEVLNEERLQMLERNQKQKALNTQYLNSASERFSTVHGDQDIQLTADFETVPFTFPSNSAQRNSTVDTVLTSALSSTSTLPILSNHVPPMPEVVVIRDYGLDSDSDEGEGDYRKSEEIIMECNSHLEVVIADLQKTVKVLQQQDRQRLEKCMGLENAVSQLEQNNEMTDVRLQLLEKKRKATDYIENPPKRRRLDSK